MIFPSFKYLTIIKAIAMALIVLINLSSLASATTPVLCIDKEETHILTQDNLCPTTCHPPAESVETMRQSYPDIFFTSMKNIGGNCVDISINSCDFSIPPHQAKEFLAKRMPCAFVSPHRSFLSSTSSQFMFQVNIQPYLSTAPLISLQTTVLLI